MAKKTKKVYSTSALPYITEHARQHLFQTAIYCHQQKEVLQASDGNKKKKWDQDDMQEAILIGKGFQKNKEPTGQKRNIRYV